MPVTQEVSASYVIIRGDGEDLTLLDPDPLRFIKAPATRADVARAALFAVVLSAVAAVFDTWALTSMMASERGEPNAPEIVIALGLAVMTPLTLLAIASWVIFALRAVSRGERAAVHRAYQQLVASRPRARLGTVRRCHYSSGEASSAYHVELTVDMGAGRMLFARERPGRPARTADGTRTGYTAQQVPQFGDSVTVFTHAGLTIVQSNHSWSRVRGATGAAPTV